MNGDHSYLSVTSGGNPLKAAMGALYARVAGNTNAATGLPTNCLVLPEAVEPGLKLGGNFEDGRALPTLTSSRRPRADPRGVRPERRRPAQEEPTTEDFHRAVRGPQKSFLAGFDAMRRDFLDATTGAMDGADKFQQQAFDVISRGVGDAFDITKEDPTTIARYDTSHLFKLSDG